MENQHKNNAIESIQELHKDWKIAEEKVVELKKENKELMNGFDTDTHILVEREKLESLIDSLEDTACNSDNAVSDCEEAQSSIDNAKWNAEEVESNVKDVLDTMVKLLKPTKGEENE